MQILIVFDFCGIVDLIIFILLTFMHSVQKYQHLEKCEKAYFIPIILHLSASVLRSFQLQQKQLASKPSA